MPLTHRTIARASVKVLHPYAYLWEPLQEDPTFVLRSMFGAKAVYLRGRLTLCFVARKAPWHGVLVATERSHHDTLQRDFPELRPHPVLPKWLYLPDDLPRFDRVAERLVAAVRQRDTRIGVDPGASRTTRPAKPARKSASKPGKGGRPSPHGRTR